MCCAYLLLASLCLSCRPKPRDGKASQFPPHGSPGNSGDGSRFVGRKAYGCCLRDGGGARHRAKEHEACS